MLVYHIVNYLFYPFQIPFPSPYAQVKHPMELTPNHCNQEQPQLKLIY